MLPPNIFPHYSHFFHIFPHFSSLPVHFPNSCHKLHCSKEKVRLPQDTFDGHFNFEPETISFRKFEQGSTSKYFPKAVFTRKVRKKDKITCAGTPKSRSLFLEEERRAYQCIRSQCTKLSLNFS